MSSSSWETPCTVNDCHAVASGTVEWPWGTKQACCAHCAGVLKQRAEQLGHVVTHRAYASDDDKQAGRRCQQAACMAPARFVLTWPWGSQKRCCAECLPALHQLCLTLGNAEFVRLRELPNETPAIVAARAVADWVRRRCQ